MARPGCICARVNTCVLGAMYRGGLADGKWEMVMECPNFGFYSKRAIFHFIPFFYIPSASLSVYPTFKVQNPDVTVRDPGPGIRADPLRIKYPKELFRAPTELADPKP